MGPADPPFLQDLCGSRTAPALGGGLGAVPASEVRPGAGGGPVRALTAPEAPRGAGVTAVGVGARGGPESG